MPDIAKVKRNIARMIDQGAPESDIDAYVASESVTLDMLQGGAAPSAPAPNAPSQPKAPRGTQATYQHLERFIKAKYPNAHFTSDYRDPQHNKDVGGVEGSYHTTRQAVDMTGLSDSERSQLQRDLLAAGVKPREFLYHNAGSGMHLHVAADALPDEFVKQWGNHPAPKPALADEAFVDENGQPLPEIVGGSVGKPAQPTEDPSVLGVLGHGAKEIGRGFVEGAGGLVDLASEAITAPFMNNPFHLSDSAEEVAARSEGWSPGAGEAAKKAYSAVAGEPEDTYTNAALQGIGNLAVPLGPVSKLGKARKALTVLLSGAGGGAGAKAGHDLFPESHLAPVVGGLIGGLPGAVPSVAGPIGDARFVGKQLKNNPYAAYDAEIAQDLTGLTKGRTGVKTDPKGRADVTVTQVNSVERRYLRGFKEKLNALDISPERKRVLKEAIEGKHDIPVEELEALRGTVEGDAVYHGIIKTQRLRELTPEIKRQGGLAKLIKFGMDAAGAVGGGAAGGPLGIPGGLAASRLAAKVLSGNGDAEAARVHSAERVIKRSKAYAKLQEKTGPSGQVEAQAALNSKVDAATVARAEAQANVRAEREANAEARKTAKAEAQAERQRKADLKASRGGLNDNQFLKTELHPPRAIDPRDVAASESHKRVSTAKAALAKLEREAARTSTRIESELTKVPKPRKRSPEDIAIEHNIAQGHRGSGGSTAYIADVIGVEPEDVLKALHKIEVPEGLEFEVEKLRHGYAAKRPATNALMPRLKAVLEKDGVVGSRKANSRPQTTPDVSNLEAPLAEGDYRPIVRKDRYDVGTERSQKAQRSTRDVMQEELSQEIVSSSRDDVEHIIANERTAEGALRHFDESVAPRLKKENFSPSEVEELRSWVERIAQGKRHKTDAQFEAATKR